MSITIDSVLATLNYVAPSAAPLRRYIAAVPPGEPQWNGIVEPHSVHIEDARRWPASPTLDRNGFALVHRPTRVGNFYDPDEVAEIYYPEVEHFLLTALGASRVLVFDHNVRNEARAAADPTVREPVRRVHNDYTFASAPQRARDLLGAEAESWLRDRFAIVNVWRPIRGPVQASPLALADGGRIDPADLIPTQLVYADRLGETFSVAWNARHRWAWFPEQQTDEAILIKCYDSATDGRARLSFHTAFNNPLAPPDAPPRESIEVRTLVFFPAEA